MSDKSNLHVSAYLNNVSIAYHNQIYVADQVYPVLPVAKQNDQIVVYGREHFRIDKDYRANGARSNRVTSFSIGTTSYNCVVYSYDDIITNRDRNNADAPIQPEVETTQGLTDKLLVSKEKRLADHVFNTTTFSGYTAAVGTKWSDLTNSDPISDALAAQALIVKQIGRPANRCVMGWEVWKELCQNPDIMERIKYTQKAILTEDLVAPFFQVEKVLVGKAVYNSAAEGATESMGYCWGKYVLFYFAPPNPSLRTPSTGYTPTWKMYGGKTAKVKKYRDEAHDGDVVEVNLAYDEVTTSARSGYLYSAVVD